MWDASPGKVELFQAGAGSTSCPTTSREICNQTRIATPRQCRDCWTEHRYHDRKVMHGGGTPLSMCKAAVFRRDLNILESGVVPGHGNMCVTYLIARGKMTWCIH